MVQQNILVAGAAGFIGSKICEFLLTKPELIPSDIMTNDSMTVSVIGIDNMNDYDDVRLKERRLLADMMATRADIARTKDMLGSHPSVKLKQGIESTVQWFFENRSWTAEIKLS
jgi:nucleoside-diphosphate-sugar epimerase